TEITHVHSVVHIEVADIDLDRAGDRARGALDPQRVDELLENSSLGDASRLAAEFDVHVGLDLLLGADAGEVEVKDLFTQIVPLDVADQDRLGLATQVQLGQMAGRLDHLPDIIVGQSDRHHLLLVPVDHGRNTALPAQPPDSPRAGPLILRRVARLDPYLQCFRHRCDRLDRPRDQARSAEWEKRPTWGHIDPHAHDPGTGHPDPRPPVPGRGKIKKCGPGDRAIRYYEVFQ